MKTPAIPPPPDPAKTAEKQGEYNLKSGLQTYELGATDQVTPYGSLTYEQVGTWHDGTPKFRASTKLSDTAQDTVDQQIGMQNKYARTAGSQLDKVRGLLSNPFKIPEDVPSPEVFGLEDYKGAIDKLGNPLDPQSLLPERQRIESALYDRMNPQLEKQRLALENRLANQGFTRGTEAWNKALDDQNRAENDARLAVVGQGGQEQSNLFNMMMGARGQQFKEALTPYQMAREDFGNTMDLRRQMINESLAERNQPLQELATLMTGASPQMPQFQNTPRPNVAGVDYAGLAMDAYKMGPLAEWQAKQQQQQAMMGGLFGLGGAAIKAGAPFMGGWGM